MLVDTEAEMIYSIDSQDNSHRADADRLASLFKVWLLGDNPTVANMKNWRYAKLPVPQLFKQKDAYNCGAFTCLYIANIAKHGHAGIDTMSYLDNFNGRGNDLRMYVFQVLFQFGTMPRAIK